MRLYCTENPEWGFHGEMVRVGQDANEAFDLAARQIGDETKTGGFAAAEFLDSRYGRQFGDDVVNATTQGLDLPRAIKAAIDRWMSWTIGSQISRETGIPADLPYLTGIVANAEIMTY